MDSLKLNDTICFCRKKQGLTQEELAMKLGVTNQSVSKWEAAQCCPDISLIPKLADIFDISTDELFGRQPSVNDVKLMEILKTVKETSSAKEILFINKSKINTLEKFWCYSVDLTIIAFKHMEKEKNNENPSARLTNILK